MKKMKMKLTRKSKTYNLYFRRAFLFPGCFRSLRRASSVSNPANRRYSTSFDEINEQSALDIAKRVAIACAVNPIPS